jgi:hypothetical protein
MEKKYICKSTVYTTFCIIIAVKNIVLEAVMVPGNLLEAVAGLHEAAKRGHDLHEVPKTLLSV